MFSDDDAPGQSPELEHDPDTESETMATNNKPAELHSDTNALGAFFSHPPVHSFEDSRQLWEDPDGSRRKLVDKIAEMRKRQKKREKASDAKAPKEPAR